jgi:hypothetical protein
MATSQLPGPRHPCREASFRPKNSQVILLYVKTAFGVIKVGFRFSFSAVVIGYCFLPTTVTASYPLVQKEFPRTKVSVGHGPPGHSRG